MHVKVNLSFNSRLNVHKHFRITIKEICYITIQLLLFLNNTSKHFPLFFNYYYLLKEWFYLCRFYFFESTYKSANHDWLVHDCGVLWFVECTVVCCSRSGRTISPPRPRRCRSGCGTALSCQTTPSPLRYAKAQSLSALPACTLCYVLFYVACASALLRVIAH